jgi:hypothetical protein
MPERLSREQIIRLLRAKEQDLEGRILSLREIDEWGYLAADVSLLFGLLADHLEREGEDCT